MSDETLVDVTDVELLANKDGSAVAARFQIVEQLPTGPRRSGRHIRLSMTAAEAMRLLSLLHGVQKALGLPVPADVRFDVVPPATERN